MKRDPFERVYKQIAVWPEVHAEFKSACKQRGVRVQDALEMLMKFFAKRDDAVEVLAAEVGLVKTPHTRIRGPARVSAYKHKRLVEGKMFNEDVVCLPKG